MDPELEGGRDCLLIRLRSDDVDALDKEMIARWKVPVHFTEHHVDAIRKAVEELQVLERAKRLHLPYPLMENLGKEIEERKARKTRLEEMCKVEFLKGIVFNKMKEIENLKSALESKIPKPGFKRSV